METVLGAGARKKMSTLAERAKKTAKEIQPTGYDVRLVDLEKVGSVRGINLVEAILHILNEMNAENLRLQQRVATLEREGRHGKGKR